MNEAPAAGRASRNRAKNRQRAVSPQSQEPAEAGDAPRIRHVAVHLHIFKNAGTSLDKVLAACFGEAYLSFDKRLPTAILTPAEIADMIAARPALRCLASHQARLPMPVADHFLAHPIFLLRDPIERVQSCFHFERDVQKLIPETLSMEEYVRKKLANPHISAAVGLQTSVLCDNRLLSPERVKADLNRDAVASAIASLHAAPAFGLVEHFAQSVLGMVYALRRYFPEFAKAEQLGDVRENISAHKLTKPDEKIRYVRESLTAGTFMRLFHQTAPDRHLYEEAKKLFFLRYADRALEPRQK